VRISVVLAHGIRKASRAPRLLSHGIAGDSVQAVLCLASSADGSVGLQGFGVRPDGTVSCCGLAGGVVGHIGLAAGAYVDVAGVGGLPVGGLRGLLGEGKIGLGLLDGLSELAC